MSEGRFVKNKASILVQQLQEEEIIFMKLEETRTEKRKKEVLKMEVEEKRRFKKFWILNMMINKKNSYKE